MSLSAHLLIRMTLTGLLCWLMVSMGVVWHVRNEVRTSMELQADQLQRFTEQQLRFQLIAVDAGGRVPELAKVVLRYGRPVCLRYAAIDQPAVSWGCEAAALDTRAPLWLQRASFDLSGLPQEVERPISLWAREDGRLWVRPMQAEVAESVWVRMRDLTGLTAATIVCLDVMVWLALRRLLRPTAGFVSALDQLGVGVHDVSLPRQGATEFQRIRAGIERLAHNLAHLTAQRRALTARLIDSQETERREISRDLHDELGQCLAALHAASAGVRQSAAQGEPPTPEDTDTLDTAMAELGQGLRVMLGRLRPPLLEAQGLPSALRELVSSWNQRQRSARTPPLRAVLTVSPDWPGDVGEPVSLVIYRACQEALTNAARYADASEPVRLQLWAEGGQIGLSVRNQMPAAATVVPQGTGLGLSMMAERVEGLGGTLQVGSLGPANSNVFELALTWPREGLHE